MQKKFRGEVKIFLNRSTQFLMAFSAVCYNDCTYQQKKVLALKMASVVVLIDSESKKKRHKYGLNVFELYIEEILAHAGIPFRTITEISGLDTCDADIVIASVTAEDEETAGRLWSYADSGGVLISYGGLQALAERLGVHKRTPAETGYALLPEYELAPVPLRYLRAEAWHTEQCAAAYGSLHRISPDAVEVGALLQQWQAGSGAIHRWAVDIPTTVAQLQLGTKPVLADGIPAPDGTAAINENILKADDGIELDWQLDRKHTDTGMPYFAYPYADYWRQLLVSHLIRCALDRGLTLPFVGQWPEGTEQVALISFDSDFNIDETAKTTLDVLQKLNVPSTWCMIEPGYSPAIYTRVLEEGHELALHYNALEKEDGVWGADAFKQQLEWVRAATGVNPIVSNKNHYTRYEGWGELFKWCEDNGIAVDQTRGPTKRGNVGFLFGTCQPYFPISWFDEQNRLYDVLEIGFVTQDMNHPALSDTSIVEPLLEQIAKVGGVAHFLFHQIHIHEKEPVRRAIGELVEKARERGYSFWTSQQVNDWQRKRRKVRITGLNNSGEVQLECSSVKQPVIVWVPASEKQADMSYLYGIPCVQQVFI
ncbi:polysaccharide deacetylase family protein [Paenibacillus sp. IITD108]|uniref:polysaccharide deacetylase family protein n=1 Tax=Paenibacillus sp. IITD108 TaxID=3116649 RepID=UPI002F3E9F1B